MTDRERVARAICLAYKGNWSFGEDPKRYENENWIRFTVLADAALSAMPTWRRIPDEVREGVAPRLWRHKKRGTVYAEVGLASLQVATERPREGDALVIYRGDDGKLWARARIEFEDGRFEPIHPLPAPPAGEV